MKTVKQLLRQPLKTAIGIIIVALAFAILVICVGQYTATDLTREDLDTRYDAVGFLSDEYFWQENEFGWTHLSKLPTEIQTWIDETTQARTDLVKTMSSTGLVSAYIPELQIDNFSQHKVGGNISEFNVGNPYRCAMLIVTLTEIGSIGHEDIGTFYADGETKELLYDTTFLCVGTVDSVIGLEDGFPSPVNKKIVLHITVYSKEKFDALNLEIGQKYIVYGMDYLDTIKGKEKDDVYETLSLIHAYRDSYEELFGALQYKDPLGMNLDYAPMLEQFDCTLTICDYSSLPWNYRSSDGFTTFWDERPFYYQTEKGYAIKSVPADEYIADYQVPTIVALNGTADEFLASEGGALWQEALDRMEINNHAFPVLCVDKLGYQAAFFREQAHIVDGRDFSENELVNGRNVCIIAQSLAIANGLQVGDSIELRTFTYDPNIELQRSELQTGKSFPSAAFYSNALGFTSEMETYTIVGLYRQDDAWQNQYDYYGFTLNTIFVPKSSVTSEMVTKEAGIYSTLVLENGKMEEFKALMEEAGYPDLFVCYDQGYSEFVASLDAYEDVSEKALYIGLAAYAILMLLFVFLFPMAQRKALVTMLSLGTHRGKRIGHIVISSAVILLPGTLIGAFAGSKLWTQVADRLMQSLNIEIPLKANMPVIAPTFAAAHLLLMALVIVFTAFILTQNNSVMKRK